ncbi:hypothetical protein AB3S75_023150 [Citrus x aurantiifolia]
MIMSKLSKSFTNYMVGTAKDSIPVLSLLAPLNSGLRQSYRRVPPSTTTVEFVFFLGILMSVGLSCLLVLVAILWLHSNGANPGQQ